jgi:hypothetical protein
MNKAKQIIAMLSERNGFDDWWDSIDTYIQEDIVESIAHIINHKE